MEGTNGTVDLRRPFGVVSSDAAGTASPLPTSIAPSRSLGRAAPTVSHGGPKRAAPRISVIIPSFNSGRFLRQALTSVLDQVPRPHEILVQDGGSTDETASILQSFGDRAAYVSAPDQGQSDALNKALARATGDIVLWLNADDVLLPGSIEAATAAFASDPELAFAYGDFDIIDGAGTLVRTYQSSPYSWTRVYRRGCYIFSGSLFVRRRSLIDIGAFDPTLRACMDFDLLLRLDGTGRSRHLGRTIGQFRMHRANKSSNMGVLFVREGFRVRRRYARGSPRLWLLALRAVIWFGLMEATARLRYSSRWFRHGGSKTL